MKTNTLATLAMAIALLAMAGFATPAAAVTISYSFSAIPGDDRLLNEDLDGIDLKVIISESVSESGDKLPSATFKFENNSDPLLQPTVKITDIYFQDILGLLSLENITLTKDGYRFVSSSTPPEKLNFAEGNTIQFAVDYAAITPGVKYGIAPGESMEISFGLRLIPEGQFGEGDYYTVAQISQSITLDIFRIGLKVQSIGRDGKLSDSYIIVNSPDPNVISVVPEPATMTLLGLGIAGIAFKARRRRA